MEGALKNFSISFAEIGIAFWEPPTFHFHIYRMGVGVGVDGLCVYLCLCALLECRIKVTDVAIHCVHLRFKV